MVWLVEVVVFLLLCLPLHPPFTTRTPTTQPLQAKPCDRKLSAIARRIIHEAWLPVITQYAGLKLPTSCPIHPWRDVHGAAELAKLHYRVNLWTCSQCGKSFSREEELEDHISSRHPELSAPRDHSVCLADFCDIFRCETQKLSISRRPWTYRSTMVTSSQSPSSLPTTSSPLPPSSPQSPRDAYAINKRSLTNRNVSGTCSSGGCSGNDGQDPSHCQDQSCRYLSSNTVSRKAVPGSGQTRVRHQDQPIGQPLIRPRKAPANKADRDQNTTSPPGGSKSSGNDRSTGRSSAGNNGRSSGGPEFVSPVDCDSQQMDELRLKCQKLLDTCSGGLALHLTDKEFQEMRGRLNSRVCWYLTCDRYWDAQKTKKSSGQPSIIAIVLIAAAIIYFIFCYYLVWVSFADPK